MPPVILPFLWGCSSPEESTPIDVCRDGNLDQLRTHWNNGQSNQATAEQRQEIEREFNRLAQLCANEQSAQDCNEQTNIFRSRICNGSLLPDYGMQNDGGYAGRDGSAGDTGAGGAGGMGGEIVPDSEVDFGLEDAMPDQAIVADAGVDATLDQGVEPDMSADPDAGAPDMSLPDEGSAEPDQGVVNPDEGIVEPGVTRLSYDFNQDRRIDDADRITIVGEAGQDVRYVQVKWADLDGDGWQDLVIGNGAHDLGNFTAEGRVYIFFGSQDRFSALERGLELSLADADVIFTGERPGSGLGGDIEIADLDQDGRDEMILPVGYAHENLRGGALVVYGRPRVDWQPSYGSANSNPAQLVDFHDSQSLTDNEMAILANHSFIATKYVRALPEDRGPGLAISRNGEINLISATPNDPQRQGLNRYEGINDVRQLIIGAYTYTVANDPTPHLNTSFNHFAIADINCNGIPDVILGVDRASVGQGFEFKVLMDPPATFNVGNLDQDGAPNYFTLQGGTSLDTIRRQDDSSDILIKIPRENGGIVRLNVNEMNVRNFERVNLDLNMARQGVSAIIGETTILSLDKSDTDGDGVEDILTGNRTNGDVSAITTEQLIHERRIALENADTTLHDEQGFGDMVTGSNRNADETKHIAVKSTDGRVRIYTGVPREVEIVQR